MNKHIVSLYMMQCTLRGVQRTLPLAGVIHKRANAGPLVRPPRRRLFQKNDRNGHFSTFRDEVAPPQTRAFLYIKILRIKFPKSIDNPRTIVV